MTTVMSFVATGVSIQHAGMSSVTAPMQQMRLAY